MKKRWLIANLSFGAALVLALTLLLSTHKVIASFNPNLIMDDYVFSNNGTMSAGQIDAFLNAFPNSCISQNANGNGNPGFRTPDPTGWSSSEPNHHGYTFGGDVTAGQAIYDAGRIYHLNPQVLLATLQKEQSSVSGSAGCHPNGTSSGQACPYSGGCLDIAMGYACPGGCNDSYKGFSLQLIAGSWLLRFAEERSLGVTSGYAGYDSGDSNIGYGGARVGIPYTLADGHTVTVQSGASGSLYYYTPFYSGNQSFVNIFESWFGPTIGGGYELVMSSTCQSACPQYVVYGNIKQYVTGAVKAAWGLPANAQLMDPNVMNTYSNGPDLGILATVNNNSVKTLYFMDGGHRYRIPGGNFIDTWDLHGKVISDVSPGLFTAPSDAGDLSNVVKDPASSTYYMLDGDNGSGQTVLRPYDNDNVRAAWEGNLNYVPISTDYFDAIDNAIGPTLVSTSASCLGSNFQVMNGGKLWQTSAIGALFPSIQSVSLATFNRLPNLGNMTAVVRSATGAAVYLIDNGTKHHILGSGLLNAWAAGGQSTTVVNDGFINALPTGADVDNYLAEDSNSNYFVMDRGNKYPVPSNLITAYSHAMTTDSVTINLMNIFSTGSAVTGFVQGIGQPALYVLDNSGSLRHLPNPTTAGLWGAYSSGITQLSNYIVSGMSTAADVQTYVSNGTTNYVMDVGKLASVGSSVATDWGLSSPLTFSDGTLSRFTTTSALTNQIYDGQTYYYIRGGNAYTTTDTNVAGMWGLIGSPVHNGSIVFSNMPLHQLNPYAQSSTDSSSYYIVDNGGTWYHVLSQYVGNLIGSAATTSLNPSYAPSTITDWAGVVVKNNGNYYAVDSATKRFLPSGPIRDQWTSSETHTDQAVDSYYLNLLRTGTDMERAVIGSGPAVYSVENETKRHITSSAVLNQSYAPVTRVSDSLLSALPTGSDIP